MSGMARLATSAPGTAHGTILGTVHYMAPEQLEGKDADARSDIWGLGAVIYEMTTGTRPFAGDTPASVIGAILKDTPPSISARQPLAPRALDYVVERCLAKDLDERWESAGDIGRLLGGSHRIRRQMWHGMLAQVPHGGAHCVDRSDHTASDCTGVRYVVAPTGRSNR